MSRRWRRWWRRYWDNRVLASQAHIIDGVLYVPKGFVDELPHIKNPTQLQWLLGMPVHILPRESKRDYEAEWRQGGRRFK